MDFPFYFHGKSYSKMEDPMDPSINGSFGGTPIYGNLHIGTCSILFFLVPEFGEFEGNHSCRLGGKSHDFPANLHSN